MCYGFDSTGLRILSFQYAKELKLIISLIWEKEQKATEDWLRGFKQRPFPKAPKRKLTTKRRKKSTTVLTETPEMNQLKEGYQKKLEVRQREVKKKSVSRGILNNDIFENIENVVIHTKERFLDVLKDKDCKVKFLRRFRNSNKFIYPDNEEISDVEYSNILRKLPKPYQNAATTRTRSTLKFEIEFSFYENNK
ncbi:hypothetical protein ILUMI_14437 [Ignelater luminosus]|uniref:Uncharacterized protein n=1 Tax=Ignelater luminosus TaxID=2038154 RepID=A0A8K0GAG8_IGNLU|nr:hypothetical protein ILUMI_14437 [Ignelater luminosus]